MSALEPWPAEPLHLAQDLKQDLTDWGVSVQQTGRQAYILLLLRPRTNTEQKQARFMLIIHYLPFLPMLSLIWPGY